MINKKTNFKKEEKRISKVEEIKCIWHFESSRENK